MHVIVNEKRTMLYPALLVTGCFLAVEPGQLCCIHAAWLSSTHLTPEVVFTSIALLGILLGPING